MDACSLGEANIVEMAKEKWVFETDQDDLSPNADLAFSYRQEGGGEIKRRSRT